MRLTNVLGTVALAALAFAAPSTNKKRTDKMEFVGVNESGPEFGTGNLPGVNHIYAQQPLLSHSRLTSL